MQSLQDRLKQAGYDAQLEASSVIEYASPPMPLGQLSDLIERVASDISHFEYTAEHFKLYRSPYAVMPSITIEQALANMNQRERLQTGISAVREIGSHGALAVPLLTAGVQVSFSPKNESQLYRMAKRAYALMPLIYSAFNSDTGYAEGAAARTDYHRRGAYYDGYEAAGGVATSFLESRNAHEYIGNHVRQVFVTPMYFAYDLNDNIIPATRENPITFAALIEKGLNTQANYELAESFLYHDVKICNLRNANGQTIGKRLEVRAADTGLHQPVSALLLMGALIPDGQAAHQFDRLLTRFGYTGVPSEDADVFTTARHNAIYHQGHYMSVGYGLTPDTGEKGCLLDFAGGVADILDTYYATNMLQPAGREGLCVLLNILRTGNSDAVKFASMFSSPQEANEYMLQPKRGTHISPHLQELAL